MRSDILEKTNVKAHTVDFGVYYDIGDSILEGIVKEGAELGEREVLEIIKIVKSIHPCPQALLANRKYKYSFSFAAMRMISRSDAFKAIAVVNYGRSAKFEIVTDRLWPKFFKLRFFTDREKAIAWLKERIKPEDS
jgi:hypothetical protein